MGFLQKRKRLAVLAISVIFILPSQSDCASNPCGTTTTACYETAFCNLTATPTFCSGPCYQGYQNWPYCNQTCYEGIFGPNCSQTCHCNTNVLCYPINGYCMDGLCACGWSGVSCSIAEAVACPGSSSTTLATTTSQQTSSQTLTSTSSTSTTGTTSTSSTNSVSSTSSAAPSTTTSTLITTSTRLSTSVASSVAPTTTVALSDEAAFTTPASVSIGAIAGIAAACVVVLAAFIASLIFCRRSASTHAQAAGL